MDTLWQEGGQQRRWAGVQRKEEGDKVGRVGNNVGHPKPQLVHCYAVMTPVEEGKEKEKECIKNYFQLHNEKRICKSSMMTHSIWKCRNISNGCCKSFSNESSVKLRSKRVRQGYIASIQNTYSPWSTITVLADNVQKMTEAWQSD